MCVFCKLYGKNGLSEEKKVRCLDTEDYRAHIKNCPKCRKMCIDLMHIVSRNLDVEDIEMASLLHTETKV